MTKAYVLAAVAALCFAGCKNKDKASSGAGSAATAPAAAGAAKPTEPAAAASAKAPTCDELGGKKQGDTCDVKTPPPIEVTFTGRFDTDMMHTEPGAVFKVTNKLGVPVKAHNAQLYAYDKSGKQLDIDLNGSKSKYSQESQMSLIDLDPNETKEFVHGVGKKNLPPDMDTVQLEITSWSAGGNEFTRHIDNEEVRAKDGWK